MIHDGSPWMEELQMASSFYMSCSDPLQTAAYTHQLQNLEAAVGYNPLEVPLISQYPVFLKVFNKKGGGTRLNLPV